MTLGERIQCNRKKCGLSQEGLAERLGVSRLFDVSTDELLGNAPPAPARHFPWYPLGLIPLAVGVFWIARGVVSVATFFGILGAMLPPDSRAAWMEEIPLPLRQCPVHPLRRTDRGGRRPGCGRAPRPAPGPPQTPPLTRYSGAAHGSAPVTGGWKKIFTFLKKHLTNAPPCGILSSETVMIANSDTIAHRATYFKEEILHEKVRLFRLWLRA